MFGRCAVYERIQAIQTIPTCNWLFHSVQRQTSLPTIPPRNNKFICFFLLVPHLRRSFAHTLYCTSGNGWHFTTTHCSSRTETAVGLARCWAQHAAVRWTKWPAALALQRASWQNWVAQPWCHPLNHEMGPASRNVFWSEQIGLPCGPYCTSNCWILTHNLVPWCLEAVMAVMVGND